MSGQLEIERSTCAAVSGNRVSSMSALTSGGAGGIYNRDVEHYGRMGSRRCSRGAFARWRTCSPNAIVDLEILAGQHAGVGRRVGRSDSPASRTSEAALERRDDGDSRRCRASAHWTDGWKSVSIRRTLNFSSSQRLWAGIFSAPLSSATRLPPSGMPPDAPATPKTVRSRHFLSGQT